MAFKILLVVAGLCLLVGAYFFVPQTRHTFLGPVSVSRPNAAWCMWVLALILAGIGWLTY
jgi:hypothetical protein